MNSQELDKLINKDKYQVFIVLSTAAFPFFVFNHPWFVINRKGKISRFEIRHHKNNDKSLGYLHINAQPPFQGIPMFYYIKKFFYRVKLLKIIEGDENSLAKKVSDFVENSKETYTYSDEYHFTGPNSNTYIQWTLNNFPEIKVKLPWNCFGKNYKQ